jgi:hypothetical protein
MGYRGCRYCHCLAYARQLVSDITDIDRPILMRWHSQGLGCRSGSYLLYGALSTVSWAILVISSLLSHYSTTAPPTSTSGWIAGKLSIALRRLGKIVASLNAVWILVVCLFQFSNFNSRCYCNSSVLGLGERAYNLISLNSDDLEGMKGAWKGGAFLAAGTAALCTVYVNLFINPELPVGVGMWGHPLWRGSCCSC